MTRKADADSIRYATALSVVSNKVFAIAGFGTGIFLSTVSYYDITSDTWKGISAQLNIARAGHSACALYGKIYVFCGQCGN